MPDPTVKLEGWREFQRDIKRLGPEVGKEMNREIRESAQGVLAEARSLAPMRTGALAKSLKLSVTQRGVSIYSTLPYAPVLHWGGTIQPRGAPITFPRTEFISRPVEQAADQIVENIGEGAERAAKRVGWR